MSKENPAIGGVFGPAAELNTDLGVWGQSVLSTTAAEAHLHVPRSFVDLGFPTRHRHSDATGGVFELLLAELLIVLFGVVWVGHRSGRGGVEVALASVDQEFNAC
jgi:hypothetical protein